MARNGFKQIIVLEKVHTELKKRSMETDIPISSLVKRLVFPQEEAQAKATRADALFEVLSMEKAND